LKVNEANERKVKGEQGRTEVSSPEKRSVAGEKGTRLILNGEREKREKKDH